MDRRASLEREVQMLKEQKEYLEVILQSHRQDCRLSGGQRMFEVPQVVKLEEQIVVVNDNDNDYVDVDEDDDLDYLLEAPPASKRPRPSTLSLVHQPLPITTISNGFPCFENFLTPSSGLTPMPMPGVVTEVIETLNTPIIHSTSFNTPGETINLMAL